MKARIRFVGAAVLIAATMALPNVAPPPSFAAELPPGGSFTDDDGLPEEGWIEAIFAAGITKGCNPDQTRFCPETTVTREQLASFLARSLDLPYTDEDFFVDDDASIHEADINRLAAAGITRGCDPPANTRYCGTRGVSRAEVATMLARAFDLPPTSVDAFGDDDDSAHEDGINRLAAAGVTAGCADGAFCPTDRLPRKHFAVFIGRALGLTPTVPPERPPPPYPDVGSGKRIIYSNSELVVWLIDEDGALVDTYPVSGRKGIPYPGTYDVFSKSVNAWAPYGGITMQHMVRFVRPGTWGNQWSYGFHSIPRWPDGTPLQTEAQLGQYLSGGCVRQADDKAAALYAWTDLGDTVIVLP